MKTAYIIVGLVVIAAIVAVVFVLSQPRGNTPIGTLGQGNTAAGGAQSTFAGIWGGLGQVGSTIAGAAS